MARAWLFIFCGCFIALVMMGSCANIVPPGGGKKDTTLPKLRSISPLDSQRFSRPKKIELQFDEYIALTDPGTQVQISPLLPVPLTVTSTPKRVTILIPDTLLVEETTYRITFGTSIRDLHEGNPFPGKGFTFTTGSYFDSLSISGNVTDARTGLADSGAFVMLYNASEGDSAIVRHKPMYVVHTDAAGGFSISGLPPRAFRLYALRDVNGNLTFDGGKEAIAFADSVVNPANMSHEPFRMRTFQEPANDTVTAKQDRQSSRFNSEGSGRDATPMPLTGYRIDVDTGNVAKRSHDINRPLIITFGRKPAQPLNGAKMFLSTDSAGITVEQPFRILSDSGRLHDSLLVSWREDAVYTLRLQKGFAKDSAGADMLPGQYTFRTKRDEDYGKLRIHLPTKYFGRGNILLVSNERDTIYQKPVLDSMVSLLRIPPGIYTLRVIVDANKNGRWDAGDLFLHRQPEVVVPYSGPINLKAGWEQQIDFETPRSRRLGGLQADEPKPSQR